MLLLKSANTHRLHAVQTQQQTLQALFHSQYLGIREGEEEEDLSRDLF